MHSDYTVQHRPSLLVVAGTMISEEMVMKKALSYAQISDNRDAFLT